MLGLDPRDVRGAEHSGACDSSRTTRFARVSGAFTAGHRAVLDAPDLAVLANRLERMDAEPRAFAYEGAGMALAADDALTPWRRASSLDRFLAGPGHRFEIPLLLGAGAAWGKAGQLHRMRYREPDLDAKAVAERVRQTWRGLAFDGWGMQEALFHRERAVAAARRPRSLPAVAQGLFDTGVGRGLWFLGVAVPERVSRLVAGFAPERAADLWAGCGYSCALVGVLSQRELDELVALSRDHRSALAQGVALANRVRRRAGSSAAHTSSAVSRICGLSSAEADRFLEDSLLEAARGEPGLDRWRAITRSRFEAAFEARRAKRHPAAPAPAAC